MVRHRPLKNPVLDIHRLQKHLKDCLAQSDEDRKMALDAYNYFKGLVDRGVMGEGEEPQIMSDDASKRCMIDSLKLIQSSRDQLLKIMGLLLKVEEKKFAKAANTPETTSADALTFEQFMAKTADDDEEED